MVENFRYNIQPRLVYQYNYSLDTVGRGRPGRYGGLNRGRAPPRLSVSGRRTGLHGHCQRPRAPPAGQEVALLFQDDEISQEEVESPADPLNPFPFCYQLKPKTR